MDEKLLKNNPFNKHNNTNNTPLFFDSDTLKANLTPTLCLEALRDMYADLYESKTDESKSVEFSTDKGKFHVKSGLMPKTHKYFAAKINGNFPSNPKVNGLPTIQGLLVLCDGNNGAPLAVLDSGVLTGIRTAAAAALAADYGAREKCESIGMIGCGTQAYYLLDALINVRPLRKLYAFDTDASALNSFIQTAMSSYGIEAVAVSNIADAAQGVDICVTATTSTQAFLTPEMIQPGTFIAAVGADNPDKLEIDPNLFTAAHIIADDPAQCASYGDLKAALKQKLITLNHIDATLAELAAGVKAGRMNDKDIVLFDSTGVGVQDVAAAAKLHEITHQTSD